MIHEFLNEYDDLKEIVKEIIALSDKDGINSKKLIKKEAKAALKILEGKR